MTPVFEPLRRATTDCLSGLKAGQLKPEINARCFHPEHGRSRQDLSEWKAEQQQVDRGADGEMGFGLQAWPGQ